MKTIAENNILDFYFETLSENQMNEVRGGGKPVSRDRDMYDLEDE